MGLLIHAVIKVNACQWKKPHVSVSIWKHLSRYSVVSLQHCPIQHDIAYNIESKLKSEFELTTDNKNLYYSLRTAKGWTFWYFVVRKNWQCYDDTTQPMIKIRWSWNCFIFRIEVLILVYWKGFFKYTRPALQHIVDVAYLRTLALILIFMTQSGDNTAHVTTAQLSWHVQNCDLILSLFLMWE